MQMDWITILSLAVAAAAVTASCLIVRRARKQIAAMVEALADVKNGNGNRRILAEPHEVTAPLVYVLNDIIVSYENRLAAYRQTEETNKQLMTSLSHDVRTPLTTLIGYLDAAHKGIVTGEERDDCVETARHKAYDLKEYIDVLFDWFKLNSDEFAMEINTVEIVELTRNILIDWIPILEDKQIEYTIDIPEKPFRVKLDPDGYRRILNNLVQNVVSHSQADHIKISVSGQDEDKSGNRVESKNKSKNESVDESKNKSKNESVNEGRGKDIVIRLADNGLGIEKEDLKHIFERLYKCDKGRSEKGSGLGLSIVRQLVEKMNGTITAESTPGQGTAFTITFPLVD